jgi:molybdate transport system ATP-binding protein
MTEAHAPHAGLSLRFAQTAPIALDIELDVGAGEVMALVGPSGSGKSTTLRSIAGLYRVGRGSIVCNGKVWFDAAQRVSIPARRRRVGLVFQNYALFPHLTALENVAEALRDRPTAQRNDEARAYLARVGLTGLEERRPHALSGGQQQRVAVARALARRPDVLLLDEPFSAVDRFSRLQLQRELAELRRDFAMPVILVTHDLEEATRLGDRLAVIHHGTILQTGSIVEVTTRPATPTVARLVGIRNIFSGTVLAERTAAGKLIIGWRGYRLETQLDPRWPADAPVSWCIPADAVIVHRRDRPSRGEQENPVHGRVEELVRLGEVTEISLGIGGGSTHPLHCSLPTHAARRNGIEADLEIGVSLRADAIQVMPPQESRAL